MFVLNDVTVVGRSSATNWAWEVTLQPGTNELSFVSVDQYRLHERTDRGDHRL